jgi:hypothetical protein
VKLVVKILSVCSILAIANTAYGQGMIIGAGAYVSAPAASHVVINNKFTNNGSFTHNGTLYFNGAYQVINGSTATTFNNIQIGSGSDTYVGTSGHGIKRALLCNGTLNAGGNLTLLSTSSQTALIDGTGTGDVLGTVIMQRYLPSAFGYKYFSSPFSNATVNEFSEEVDFLSDFPRLYRYEENTTSTGWYYHTVPSDPLEVLQGYAANLGDAGTPITADLKGEVNNGPLSTGTISNNNMTYTEGFHLVGNPYPSPIDWDAASGWTRTNVDDAVYYFDAGNTDEYEGTYSSYINGISSDGIADNIIPAMQGFFIHVSDGSYPVAGSLAINNNVRVNSFNPVYHKLSPPAETPLIRVSAKFDEANRQADGFTVYFNEGAGPDFDKGLDALKMRNTDKNVPNVYAATVSGQRLSISALPVPNDSISAVPLTVEIAKAGVVAFNTATLDNLPAGMHAYFADAVTGIITEMKVNRQYRAALKEGKHENRFSVIFSRNELPANLFGLNALNAYAANGNIYLYLNLVTGDKGSLVINNTLGQAVYKQDIAGYGYHTIEAPFSPGIYIATFYSRTGKHSKKLFIANQ